MKATYTIRDPQTSPAIKFHMLVTLTAETAEEGFQLGLTAMSLRQRDIWTLFDAEKASLTLQVVE